MVDHQRISILPALLCLMGLLVNGCSDAPPTAGGTGDETVIGVLFDSAHAPIPGARVALASIPLSGIAIEEPAFSYRTTTDTNGEFVFTRVVAGIYSLASSTRDSMSVGLIGQVDIGSAETTLVSDTLTKACTIAGSIGYASPFECRVALLQTPYSQSVNSPGAFSITHIAAGSYRALVLAVNPVLGRYGVIDSDSTEMLPGASASLRGPAVLKTIGGAGRFVFDDLDDGNRQTLFGGYWNTFDDRNDKGNSTVTPNSGMLVAPGRSGSGWCAFLAFRAGDAATTPYAGFSVDAAELVAGTKQCIDLSRVTRLHFWAKSRAGQSLTIYPVSPLQPLINAPHFTIDSLLSQWTSYTLDVGTDLIEPYDSSDARSWHQTARFASGFAFTLSNLMAGDSVELYIDDVELE